MNETWESTRTKCNSNITNLDGRLVVLEAMNAFKGEVTGATTANITIANAQTTIDGITCADGQTYLVKDQTDAKQNGIYELDSSKKPVRIDWADSTADFVKGIIVKVQKGTANADTVWTMTTDAPTLGTDEIAFARWDAYGATDANTANKVVKRDSSGNFSAGTITANITGNCSGSSGSCTGNAVTATSATTATTANSIAAASIFKSTEQTGTGSEQDIAHGLGSTPTLVFIIPTEFGGDGADYAEGTHDATNCKATVTSGAKFKIVAIK